MKIYFIGTASSGKTTLAKAISLKTSLPLLPEVARQILAEKEIPLDSLRTDLELINKFQKEIFYRQIHEESRDKDFVSDRSLIDALAYTAQYTSLLPELINTDECKKYFSEMKDTKTSLVFFVRPNKAMMKADGIRETLVWEEMVQIDAMIKFIMEANDIKYVSINSTSIQERINLVMNVINLFILK